MPFVYCFGEILWDFLPEGIFPGGAPFNVAYHLHAHGVQVQVVSAVGTDLLGDELIRRLRVWGLETAGIVKRPGLPTGYVRATVSAAGDASYEITPSVAWDQIELTADTLLSAPRADAIVFGSLAQRSPANRAALRRLLAILPPEAMRIFDVNLRAPHDDLSLVRELAAQSSLLKLNAAEAARIASGAPETPGAEEEHARLLASRSGCSTVCVTAGARGAGLLRGDRWLWEPARSTVVADTVGAGDSFLASLVTHLLHGRLSDGESLARACRTGEWVASQRGATPAYPSSPIATNETNASDHE